jgi:hypothetical protein
MDLLWKGSLLITKLRVRQNTEIYISNLLDKNVK